MDNLTHTLIGVTIAHSLPKKYQKPEVYWASVVGNNLPDSDVIQNIFPGTSSLDSLVHHRGFTHSFLLAFGLAYVGAWFVTKFVKAPDQRTVTREIYLFTLLGCFLHIAADFMNNYGVHPFSPFYNQWFYGDSVFIIEPWLWMTLIPMAIVFGVKRSAKIFWSVLLVLGLSLVWLVDYVVLPVKIAVSLMAAVSYWVHLQKQNARVALSFMLGVIVVFFSFSQIAKHEIRNTTHSPFADIEATPSPGNPFCWGSWSQKQEGEEFVMRLALVTPFPNISKFDQCGAWRAVYPRNKSTQLLDLVDLKNPKVLWRYESRLNVGQYQFLNEHSCRFQRLMSFVRFPYVLRVDDQNWIAGDLRYDIRDRKNFTEMQIADVDFLKPAQCVFGNSPWRSPFQKSEKLSL